MSCSPSTRPNGAPGSEGKTGDETVRTTPQGEHITASVHHPSMGVVLPSKETATGVAVVIAPGELLSDARQTGAERERLDPAPGDDAGVHVLEQHPGVGSHGAGHVDRHGL